MFVAVSDDERRREIVARIAPKLECPVRIVIDHRMNNGLSLLLTVVTT